MVQNTFKKLCVRGLNFLLLSRSAGVRRVLLGLIVGIAIVFLNNISKTFPAFTQNVIRDTGELGPLLPHLRVEGFPSSMDHPPHMEPGRQPPWLQKHEKPTTKAGKRKEQPKTVRGPNTWSRHIKEVCDDNGVAWNRDNFKPEMLKHIVVDDTHKVLFCPIPKVACTTWVRVLLALTGKIKMEDTFRLPSGQIHSKWNQLKYLSTYSRDEVISRLQHYYKFILVREPYERILSAYKNKFEKPENLTGFHFVHGKPIVRKYRTGIPWKRIPMQKRYRPTFAEYVQYLSDSESGIKMNNHWEKFYILCQPCIVHYDFVGNMANMEKDAETILKKIGVANKIKFPTRRQVGYIHNKTETLVSKYFTEANISDTVMDDLFKQYRLDFEIFNMSLPKLDKS